MLACSSVAGNPSSPDYELADRIVLTGPSQVKAISHPLRTTILGLLHERAATVTELALAVERPKSTIAHHVKVLAEAGLVQVVRTRRVRAIEERFYGRTARMFYVGVERSPDGDDLPRDFNDFEVAARESGAAYRDGKLWGFIRHSRISEAQASEFWEQMAELVAEFDQLPRSGETVYGFAVGVYPTEYPTLPSRDDKDAAWLVTRSRRTDASEEARVGTENAESRQRAQGRRATGPRQGKLRKSKQSRDE
jgi:DNA-binding transcriptional ArsR family regulator